MARIFTNRRSYLVLGALVAAAACSDAPTAVRSRDFGLTPFHGVVAQIKACGAATITPNGDGDGDGTNDDELLRSHNFGNTIVQIWCINGGARGGFYYSALVDGVAGQPFRFVGKCSWKFGSNTLAPFVKGGKLVEFGWTSTDADGPGFAGSGNIWVYSYNVNNGTITAVKLDKHGKVLKKRTISAPVSPPYDYEGLPGGADPVACTIP